jgi:hypothetical protein
VLLCLWAVKFSTPKNAPAQGQLPSVPPMTHKQAAAMPPQQKPAPQPQAAAPAKAGYKTPPAANETAKPAVAARLSATAPKDETAAKVLLLEEILQSRNDNDMRLDTAFNNLSPETRRVFRKKYANTRAEGRNERGTIVYLLGKNLKTAEDWEFLRQVATEPPCLSMVNCSKAMPRSNDPHAEMGNEVTLAYPALVAVMQAEKVLAAHKAGKPVENEAFSVQQAHELVQAAKTSASKIVSEKAARLEQRF